MSLTGRAPITLRRWPRTTAGPVRRLPWIHLTQGKVAHSAMSFIRMIIDKLFRRKRQKKNDASIYPMF